ncbi:acyl-CoA-binding domain-containing protein 5-B isoform X3 [Triplophysa dalaica]|uniref:acyl-CoA-binding domain-containing protein 5-B isoform X3 n=1 Tax=Triplophysa dalaica TaxID=1582913 RepID=UPI0024E03E8D|nr:acyl-CoA-binding domain-containing protein 5-B isoform X3 [Triplophysa dalaica]
MDKTQVPMDDPKSVQRMFEAAVKVMRSLPEDGAYELSDDMLAIFYCYYKQATVGPCNTLKPNSWDPIGKDKWEAWKALGNISKYQAMREYVQEIQLIIETLPVTDRMAELMDALDPFYEIVEDEDEAACSKPAQLSTGGTNGDKEGDADLKGEEDESDSSVVNIEDDADLMEVNKDLNILAAREGGLLVFNGSEESSVSSSTNETHSSLNTEVQEDELVYCREPPNSGSSDYYPRDESDDDLYSDSIEQPETTQKGSGVPRVRLADVSAVGANIKQRQGGNREAQCGNQDGKPQGVTPPVPHPPALGTVQTDRMSQSRGREITMVAIRLVPYQCSACCYVAFCCALACAGLFTEEEEMVKEQSSEVKIQGRSDGFLKDFKSSNRSNVYKL